MAPSQQTATGRHTDKGDARQHHKTERRRLLPFSIFRQELLGFFRQMAKHFQRSIKARR